MGDVDVLAWAVREARILLTFDKDFGELAFAAGLPAACGVILFRLPMPRSITAGAMLARLVSSRTDWAGHFSVIEPGRRPYEGFASSRCIRSAGINPRLLLPGGDCLLDARGATEVRASPGLLLPGVRGPRLAMLLVRA